MLPLQHGCLGSWSTSGGSTLGSEQESGQTWLTHMTEAELAVTREVSNFPLFLRVSAGSLPRCRFLMRPNDKPSRAAPGTEPR